MCRKTALFVTAAILVSCGQSVLAQQAVDKNAQAAVAKAQFMLRQVSNEKAQLEVKNKELQTQLDALTKKTSVLEKEQKVAELGKEKMSGQIVSIRDKYIALVEKYNELRTAFITEKQEGQKTELKMQERDSFIRQCVENNRKLFTINQEILGKYEEKGFWDVMNQKEAVTGLSQVEIENLLQEYQFQNEDAQINEKMIPQQSTSSVEQAVSQ